MIVVVFIDASSFHPKTSGRYLVRWENIHRPEIFQYGEVEIKVTNVKKNEYQLQSILRGYESSYFSELPVT